MTHWTMMVNLTGKVEQVINSCGEITLQQLFADLKAGGEFPGITVFDVRDAVIRLASRGVVEFSDGNTVKKLTKFASAAT